MKRSAKYKISSLICLGLVMISYNQCVPTMDAKKSSLQFSATNASGSGNGNGNGGSSNENPYNSEEIKAISMDAFKTTVYPVTKARCVSCHGVSQTPLHASSNIETAYNSLVDNFKIDFNNIASSRLVLKLKNDHHNCWGDCAENATEMQNQITEWKRLVDLKAPNATDSTNNVTSTTTDETNTVEEILNPENIIDQGTITLMAESGSLKAPMVKATANGVSYIWSPEGTGLKTLTSADAGLAYVNFKVTTSDFYKIYMLVDAPDAKSASTYLKVAASQSIDWHILTTKGFEWREVTSTTAKLDSPFYITGGIDNGIEIRQRDDGLKISKITITNDTNFNPTVTKALKSTISVPLSALSGVSGSMLDIDIEEYDMYSYKLSNPRIRTSQEFNVKTLKVLVNGNFNPQHATYLVVDKKVTPTDGVLSPYSMILLKDKGSAYDKLSFNFGIIGNNKASTTPKTTTPTTPTTTMPTLPTPAPTIPVVTKLTSVKGFEQTLYPILRARCVGCHGASQPPLHSSADVNIAHTNVTETALVNFTNITSSKISVKLKTNKHNCWSDCNANAAEIEGQIGIWKNLSGK